MNIKKIAGERVLTWNPLFIQLLGVGPALAVSTSVEKGIGIGILTGAVLVLSNFFISLPRKFIPKQIKPAAYIIIVSVFVTALEMLLKAYMPDLEISLGIFIPLIAVNCLLFLYAESFDLDKEPLRAILENLFTGLGFMAAVVILSAAREVLGAGTFAGVRIIPQEYSVKMLASPAGAFITLGLTAAVFKGVLNIADKFKNKNTTGLENAEITTTESEEIINE
ncbi:MAG: electron transport complex subunit RsxE [Oscillospiraceae bacterium]|nr:electron transport complex subunit RsxE [Oscillospiraceae bacterium]